ncbi:hypothetical protein [Burkholderia cenocepacia]|uniref:hypothetical protein n=1 Tax=Burkholderia cenocepacia TaxID=95486 RepID=UPI002653EDC7|nr:hypothetical protein [Burkholderia cenocepacia]MDN7678046.1 hypothetical protein [Burkholderia cenocepacia]
MKRKLKLSDFEGLDTASMTLRSIFYELAKDIVPITLRRFLDEHNIPYRATSSKKRTKQDIEQVIETLKKDDILPTCGNIGKALGVSRQRACVLLAENKIRYEVRHNKKTKKGDL